MVTFFSDLLSEMDEERGQAMATVTSHIPKLVTQEHNALLMRMIEPVKVEEVVFQMEKGKVPGPDGFTVDFFQHC